MANARCRTICRVPSWNKNREGVGLEHLLLEERVADSVVLAFDEEHGAFRLTYRLTWDESWRPGRRDGALLQIAESANGRTGSMALAGPLTRSVVA